MEVSTTNSTTPPVEEVRAIETEKPAPTTSKVAQRGVASGSRSQGLTNQHKDKLVRSAVSRVGNFILMKCAKKRNTDSDVQDEYFLADNLLNPNEETRTILAKFDKQIKSGVVNLKAPIPMTLVFIGYKTQQVSGKDYFFKVKASNSGQYFHVRIYESLQHELILQEVIGPKLNSDKIEIVN